jgi:hypothetical protein
MMATSSGAITEAEAREYGHDIELLAKNGYLKAVDVTLLSGVAELRAVRYEVNEISGQLTASRPGGVLWPKMPSADFRVVLFYNTTYTAEEKVKMSGKLKISWGPTSVDTSHGTLKSAGGRDYSSNGWAMERKDFGQ